jgi:hypothetical protein
LKRSKQEIIDFLAQIPPLINSGEYIFCDHDEADRWSRLYCSAIYVGLKSKDLNFNLDISITSDDKLFYSIFIAGFVKEYSYSIIPTRRLSTERLLETAEPTLKVFVLFNLDIFGEDYGF